MSEKKEQSASRKPSNADFQCYEKTVEMLAHLRDEGHIIIYLGARFMVRVIGDLDYLRDRLSAALDAAQLDGKKARSKITEVCNIMQVCLFAGNKEHATDLVDNENNFTSASSKKKDADTLARSEESAKKVAVVFEKLINSTLQERATRLATITGPILQDVDVEVVTERRSEIDGNEVRTPFIRLKLRHTDRSGGIPFFFPAYVPMSAATSDSFDLECDETDINMMIRRLQGAKDLLLKTLKSMNQISS